MVLAKVSREFRGATDELYRIGEVLKVDVNSHLTLAGLVREIEPDTPTVKCSCGRRFLRIDGEEPEQLLDAHIAELGEGHEKAKVKEKVPA